MRRRAAGSKKYLLSVYTEGDATVTVNGITRTAASFGVANFYLKKGSYSYSVSKSGFYSQSGTVTVNGDTTEVVRLEKILPADPPVMHLPLSENADDISGNNRVVDAYNVTYRNGRAYLDGNNSYIDTRYVISLPVTICFKCKLADVTSKQGNHYIISARDYYPYNDWPSYTNMLLTNDLHQMQLYSYGNRYIWDYEYSLEQYECDVVVVFTPSYSKCYLNGTLLLNAKGNSSAADGNLLIGYLRDHGFTTEMTVRDFKIYEVELSEQDIINGNY